METLFWVRVTDDVTIAASAHVPGAVYAIVRVHDETVPHSLWAMHLYYRSSDSVMFSAMDTHGEARERAQQHDDGYGKQQ